VILDVGISSLSGREGRVSGLEAEKSVNLESGQVRLPIA
jgi:hypothetical protein